MVGTCTACAHPRHRCGSRGLSSVRSTAFTAPSSTSGAGSPRSPIAWKAASRHYVRNRPFGVVARDGASCARVHTWRQEGTAGPRGGRGPATVSSAVAREVRRSGATAEWGHRCFEGVPQSWEDDQLVVALLEHCERMTGPPLASTSPASTSLRRRLRRGVSATSATHHQRIPDRLAERTEPTDRLSALTSRAARALSGPRAHAGVLQRRQRALEPALTKGVRGWVGARGWEA